MAKNATNANADAPKGAPAMPAAPQGERLGRAAGPGNLNPGAGISARKTGKPVFCGYIAGTAFAFTDHSNSKDPKKTSTRFAGDFIFQQPNGAQTSHAECYLPGVAGNGIRAALSRPGNEGVDVALEIWAEPDEYTGRQSAIGYEYAAYNRMKRDVRASRTHMLLANAGIMELPALPAPSEPGDDVDPETGEVTHPAQRGG